MLQQRVGQTHPSAASHPESVECVTVRSPLCSYWYHTQTVQDRTERTILTINSALLMPSTSKCK
jgi:hypothetical protein